MRLSPSGMTQVFIPAMRKRSTMHISPCSLCGAPINGLCHRDHTRQCTHWECRFAQSIPLETLRDEDGYYDPHIVSTKLITHVHDHAIFPTVLLWRQFLSVYQNQLCAHAENASCSEPCCSWGLRQLLEEERQNLGLYEKRALWFQQLSTPDKMERFYNHISQQSLHGGTTFCILDVALPEDCLQRRWATMMVAKLQHIWAKQQHSLTSQEKQQWLQNSQWNGAKATSAQRALYADIIRQIVAA